MKKAATVLLCAVIALAAAGCWSSGDLNEYAFVVGVAVDQGSTPDNILLTVQVAKPSGFKSTINGGGGSGEDAYWNISNEGETLFNAVRGFTHESGRKLDFQHNTLLIYSRDIAEKGLWDCMDLFVRDHEFRTSTWVAITDEKAADVFEVEAGLETLPAVEIDKMMDSQQYTSQSYTTELLDFLKRLKSDTTAPLAPIISIRGEGEDRKIHISGAAVFHKDQLIGELSDLETRGLMWVTGNVKSGILIVDCPCGQGKVELEIFQAKSSVTPVLKDGNLSFLVEIKEKGNLGSQTCSENLASTKKLDVLSKRQNEAIKTEIEAALKKAQELNADIFGFGEAVYRKYPKQWKSMKDQWSEIFPTLDVEIKVQSDVYGTGNITKPVN
ncbi:MAG TPA: Ger(x)C family spore germination protein [Clostridiales bacterium]|nr:Ger(x)C family spore germination protein [Clostridiales bacterium]